MRGRVDPSSIAHQSIVLAEAGRRARRAMRLVLVFSGFLAAAVAAATSDAARGSILSTLTGRVDDAAAANRDDDEFADVAAPPFVRSMVSEYRDASSRAS